MPDPWAGDVAVTCYSDELVMQEQNMSDLVNGIRHIGPSYPVKPVQPVQKDRKPGDKPKKRREPDANLVDDDIDQDDDKLPTIDELV